MDKTLLILNSNISHNGGNVPAWFMVCAAIVIIGVFALLMASTDDGDCVISIKEEK